MTNEKYEELAKLAEAATEGVWTRDKTSGLDADVRALHADFPHKGYPVALCWGLWKPGSKESEAKRKIQANANAAYIAAANPAAIKELLSELSTLRAAASAPKAELTDERIVAAWDAQRKYHGGEPCKVGHVEFARSVLAQAAPVAAVPVGYALVPAKLTPEMKSVIKEMAPRWNAESIYGNLLAAAPAAPVAAATLTDDEITGAAEQHAEEIDEGRDNTTYMFSGEALISFVRAVQYAASCGQSAPVAAAVPAGWVSVDERLPAFDFTANQVSVFVHVIAALFDGSVYAMHYRANGWTEKDANPTWAFADGRQCRSYHVTHWMPLPPAPTQQTGGGNADLD